MQISKLSKVSRQSSPPVILHPSKKLLNFPLGSLVSTTLGMWGRKQFTIAIFFCLSSLLISRTISSNQSWCFCLLHPRQLKCCSNCQLFSFLLYTIGGCCDGRQTDVEIGFQFTGHSGSTTFNFLVGRVDAFLADGSSDSALIFGMSTSRLLAWLQLS